MQGPKILFAFSLLFAVHVIQAQTVRYDNTFLSSTSGTTTVSDATALGGSAFVRTAGTASNTAWFGPYSSLQAGSYTVQFRLKVASNTSTATICTLDISSNTTGVEYGALNITPSMFKRSNDWQIFTLTVQIPVNVTDIETRGMAFVPNITDLYLDYVAVVSSQDFYANDLISTGTGKVGIGTTTPQAILSLGAGGGKKLLVYDGGNGGVQTGLGIDMSGTSRELAVFSTTSDGNNGNISFGKRLESSGAYTEMMRIQGNGSVGIGTANINDASYKLFVETGIRTRKVKVDQTSWPDYIFNASYRLRPLGEVEQYIQQNHHLPEVPSAAQVEKDGLNLGDNQATLLKKIEELTLYIIEQNKRIEKLEKKLDSLQQQNK